MSDSVICLARPAKPADSETVVLASFRDNIKWSERGFHVGPDPFGWFRHNNMLIHVGTVALATFKHHKLKQKQG